VHRHDLSQATVTNYRLAKASPFEERRKAPSPFTASRAALAEKRPSEKPPPQQRSGLYGKRIA
jgi:hypothetical protein